MNAYDIIRRAIITEKGNEGIDNKKYTFEVAKDANKTQIKAAIEEIFKVKVAKVNTVNVRGKLKRQGRTQGYTASYKKAYVQLAPESKAIEFFESMA